MSKTNKSSDVLLLLKKKGIFSKASQVKAKLVEPNLEKIFYQNDHQLKKKFYDIILQEIDKKNIGTIICSKKFYENLKKFGLNKEISFINDNLEISNQISVFNIDLNLNKFLNKNALVCIKDYYVRDITIKHLKSNAINVQNVINIIKDNAKFFDKESFFPLEKNIYPIEIPEIKTKDNIDVLLIDCPSRNLSLLPNGLGYVYNVLKQNNFNFDILDLDIISYHRFHMRRIYDEGGIIELKKHKFPEDPWRAEHYDFWIEKNPNPQNDKNISEVDHFINSQYEQLPILKFLEPILNETIEEIKKKKPKIVGLSIQNCNTPFSKILVKKIKEFDKDILILVGGFSCYNADIGLQAFPDADYMCIGEADLTVGPLVKKLLQGERPYNLAGVLSKFDKPDYHKNFVQAPMIHDLDRIQAPKYEWTDLSLYRNFNDYQLVPIIASRGCRWSRCTFCAERFYWRIRSAENFVDELEWLVSQGTHVYMFNESDLNGMPERVLEICDEIIKRGLNKKIILTGQLRIHKKSTKEFFQKLYLAGFRALRFGVDAFSKNTLKLQQKGYTVEMIDQNLKDCHEAGIATEVNWVIGVPGETEEDVEEGINLILRNKKYIGRLANINPLILANGGVYWINPEEHNIKFTQPKEELYKKFPRGLPAELWYSENPFIDANVRKRRFEHIVVSLYRNGFPLGDWASKIVEVVMTRDDNSELKKENNKTDKYNYEPDFRTNDDNNNLKFYEIFKQYKIYTYKDQYFSIPISRNINLNDIEALKKDKDILKNKDVTELKEQLLENARFAESRGQYEVEEKNKNNIYKVDSFSEEQNFEKEKLISQNSSLNIIKFKEELFVVTDEIDFDINDHYLEKVVKVHENPELISNFEGMNIVRYQEMYYAIPQGLRMNWVKETDLLDVHIRKSSDLDTLFKKIGQNKKTYKIKIKLQVILIQLNWLMWKIPDVIKNKGMKYFLVRSLFLINQRLEKMFRKLGDKIKKPKIRIKMFRNFVDKIKKPKINIEKLSIHSEVKNNMKTELQAKPNRKEIFVKNLDNYKIYQMEEVYFAFPADHKVDFEKEDYALDDNVIKDYSIDAVETKIIELN